MVTMRIDLPPLNSPRRPIAYRYDHETIDFLFPEREEVFFLKSTGSSTFWHDYCRHCSLLYLGQCSGGSPTGNRPLIALGVSNSCYKDYEPNEQVIPVLVKLTNHLLSFSIDEDDYDYLTDPYFYFVGEKYGKTQLFPYLVGNVASDGDLCTQATCEDDLDYFLNELFSSVWNSDHSYWLNYMNKETYTTSLHINWLKNINYEAIIEDSYGKYVSLATFTLIRDTDHSLFIDLEEQSDYDEDFDDE